MRPAVRWFDAGQVRSGRAAQCFLVSTYRHILLPTDGSPQSEEAAAAGIRLARAIGARVTAVHVIPMANSPNLAKWAHCDAAFDDKLEQVLGGRGALYLETVRDLARLAGVPCDCRLEQGPSPHAGILATAAENGCDLIVMASHSRAAHDGELLASETVKAATRGNVPVLVHH
jgi:nucleotide-binding universal stress UspA family protein